MRCVWKLLILGCALPEPVLRSDYGFYPISLPLDATTLMISKVAAMFKEVSVVYW